MYLSTVNRMFSSYFILFFFSLCDVVEAFAQKCAEIGESHVMPNILFCFHLISKNYEKANEIWNKYLKDSRGETTFASVLAHAYHNLDSQLVLKLLPYLEERSNVDDTLVLAHVYEMLIKIHGR